MTVSLALCRLLGFVVRFQRSGPDFVYLTCGQAQLMINAWHVDGWHTAPLALPGGRGSKTREELVGLLVP